jgi:CRISPR-associated protein Cmr6
MPEPRYPKKGFQSPQSQGSAGGRNWRFPLPKEVGDQAQAVIGKGQVCINAGLRLDHFTEWEERYGELKRAEASDKRRKIPKTFNVQGLNELLSAYKNRWYKTLDSYETQGYRVQKFPLCAASRVVVGLGTESVLETSIRLHRIYGFPIIPGSALKGLARAYAEVVEGRNEEDSLFADVFGKSPPEAQAGEVIFFDAIPANPDTLKLELDVMNPHYAPYYQGTQPPADYHSPVPIFFLTIGPGSEFLFAVASQNADLATKAKEWLKKALEEMGVGAKTVAGYGLWTECRSRSANP